MSSTKLPEQIEVIPLDEIITIKLNGHFYSRLAALLQTYCSQMSAADLAKTLVSLEQNGPQSEYEFNLVTLMTLTQEIEQAAREQKKSKMTDLPKSPNPDSPSKEETAPEN